MGILHTSDHPSRTRWAAIGAAVAVTLGAAGIGSYNLVNADVSTGDRPVFVPIAPCRLVDTRPGDLTVGPKTSPLGPAEVLTVTAHGENGNCTGASAISSDATALAMNVTALGATSQTFLTFWGDGANPGTANLNPAPGQPPTPNAVNTPLSDAGTFQVFNERGAVNIVIDVNGYYAPHDHDDRYPLATDVYTKTESDARFGPAQERIALSLAGATVVGGGGVITDGDCIQTGQGTNTVQIPVALPVGASIDRVELSVRSKAGSSAEFIVGFYRTTPNPLGNTTLPVAASLGGVGLAALTKADLDLTPPAATTVQPYESYSVRLDGGSSARDHSLCSAVITFTHATS